MKRSKGPWTLFFLLMIGLIFGGFIGDYLGNFVKQLSFQQVIGMSSPMMLNLNVIKLSFMLSFKINVGTVAGIIVALYAYYKM
ncbi:MAG: DUF4321 domain-containing protein [Thermoanaerobacteraceae bacterium]|jgi:hypothetical protein|nr:DUF4321 domain-containing protein [Thermoanaerobacteraceae bacterium]